MLICADFPDSHRPRVVAYFCLVVTSSALTPHSSTPIDPSPQETGKENRRNHRGQPRQSAHHFERQGMDKEARRQMTMLTRRHRVTLSIGLWEWASVVPVFVTPREAVCPLFSSFGLPLTCYLQSCPYTRWGHPNQQRSVHGFSDSGSVCVPVATTPAFAKPKNQVINRLLSRGNKTQRETVGVVIERPLPPIPAPTPPPPSTPGPYDVSKSVHAVSPVPSV